MKSFDQLFAEVFDVQSEHFKQGKQDAENGKPCQHNTHDYLQGYAAGYESTKDKRGQK